MMNMNARKQSSRQRRFCRGGAVLFVWLLLNLLCWSGASAMEAEWTPNPEDDGSGPLPLSQAQREQLLQLEQAIVSSPDPQGTLKQVAEANNMTPQELVKMLERNRQDMGGAVPTSRTIKSWPQTVLKVLSSLGLLLSQTAQRNPRSFTLAAMSIVLLIHVLISAPRTGLVLSSKSSLLSRGHTTMWNPPPKYVSRYMDTDRFAQTQVSLPKKSKTLLSWDDLPEALYKDGVEVHKLNRKSSLVQAVTAQRTLSVDSFVPKNDAEEEEEDDDDDDDDESDDEVDYRQEVFDIMYDSAADVLSSRRLTEFVDSSVRLQSSQDSRRRSAILVVQKMGNWGRFGLQPLRVAHQQEGNDSARLTYTTLKGGHFDGQIDVSVERKKNDSLRIQVRLGVPKKGRKLNKKLASKVANSIAESIAKSIATETKQAIARKSQGKRYRGSYESRQAERRHIRYENEKKQEEMARDRRRKWQRQNPDAGHYRPSGERMRSPNNAKLF